MDRDGTLAFGQEAKESSDAQRSIRSIKRILGTPERGPLVGQNLRTERRTNAALVARSRSQAFVELASNTFRITLMDWELVDRRSAAG